MALLDFIDKLDDIIYEPVKVVCDYARVPLQVAEKYTDVKKKEYENGLEVKLRRGIIEVEDYERQLSDKRSKDVLEFIKQYQIDMAEATVRIGNTIGSMSLELRDRAQKLIQEHTRSYERIQQEAIEKAEAQYKKNELNFAPGSAALDSMNRAVDKKMFGILDATENFMKSMEEDLKAMNSNIDELTKEIMNGANNLLNTNYTQNAFEKVNDQNVLDNKSEVRYLN